MTATRTRPTLPDQDRSFMVDAACRDKPTSLFFPPGDPPRSADVFDPGKAICAACPVASRCLSYAITGEATTGESWPGLWGGLTPTERKALAGSSSDAKVRHLRDARPPSTR